MISKKFIVSLLLSCSLFSFSYAQLPASGLVAHYPFSGNAQDAIGSHDGTVFGAQLTTNRFGQTNSAYVFDGINDYISIADDDAIDFAYNQNFSISLWLLVDPTQNDLSGRGNEILSKWDDLTPTSYPYAIRYLNSTSTASDRNKVLALRFSSDPCTRAPALKSTCPLSLNVWHHMALVKNGSTLSYYQDGVLLGQVTDNTVAACDTKNSLPVHIAQRANNFFFKGKIDDVAFYNRSLTPKEINDIVFENGWTIPVTNPNAFSSFSIPQQISPADINAVNRTINVEVSCATDVSSLIASFTINRTSDVLVNGVTQNSGATANDFTMPVIYKLDNTDDCLSTDWVVTVVKENLPSQPDENQILSYAIPGQVEPSIIDVESSTIVVPFDCPADVASQIASFTLPPGSTAAIGPHEQVSGVSINNFTKPVIYTVSNTSLCRERKWKVTVRLNRVNLEEIDATNLQFFLPNIITPNGDSDNQHFMVGDFFRGSEFNLYNRYGKKVYENPSYQNEFNGGSLSSGMYYYTLRHPCLNEPIKGFLHIIR